MPVVSCVVVYTITRGNVGGLGRSQELLQLAGPCHLLANVAAAHEFALDIQLRDGRPGTVSLDGITQAGVVELVQNIDHLQGCRGCSGMSKLVPEAQGAAGVRGPGGAGVWAQGAK